MESNELYHYGVKGQKWGVRRTPLQLGHKTSSKKKSARLASRFDNLTKKLTGGKKKASAKAKTEKKPEQSKKKSISEMSDEELQKVINRARLETEYKKAVRDLSSSQNKTMLDKGVKFASEVLSTAGKDLATQVAKELGAKVINKALFGGEEKVFANNKKK